MLLYTLTRFQSQPTYLRICCLPCWVHSGSHPQWAGLHICQTQHLWAPQGGAPDHLINPSGCPEPRMAPQVDRRGLPGQGIDLGRHIGLRAHQTQEGEEPGRLAMWAGCTGEGWGHHTACGDMWIDCDFLALILQNMLFAEL